MDIVFVIADSRADLKNKADFYRMNGFDIILFRRYNDVRIDLQALEQGESAKGAMGAFVATRGQD